MRAVQITRFGGPEVLVPAEVARPEPGVGEVLIRVAAAGVNFADSRMRAGGYVNQPPLPLIPGFEAAGYVEAVGPGAELLVPDPAVLVPGTPVIAGHAENAYAEYARVPADLLFPLPEGKSLAEAGAIPVNYAVAWCALHQRGALRAGETVLVHAAGGGVGSVAVQLAAKAGARVVATASSAAKLELARRAGASLTINYVAENFVDRIREELGGDRPIDLVIDSVGGQTLVDSLSVLRPWGRLVGFGQASDTPATLDLYASAIPNHLDLRFLARGSITLSRNARDRAVLIEAMRAVVGLWERGEIAPPQVHHLPLDEAAEAHRRLIDRSNVGKIVLTVEA